MPGHGLPARRARFARSSLNLHPLTVCLNHQGAAKACRSLARVVEGHKVWRAAESRNVGMTA
eukprot:351732-Chlamydomonas_euryale.AAC.8